MLPKPILKPRRFHSGTQTIPVLAVDVDTQTAPTLPMVDRETQTSHRNLIDLIEKEWEVQLEKREMHLYHGNDVAADEITNVDLPPLDRI